MPDMQGWLQTYNTHQLLPWLHLSTTNTGLDSI